MTAQGTPVPVTVTGAVNAGPCTYRGFSIGSVLGADVVIYDNASAASGTVLAAFTIAAKGWAADDITDGARCAQGIYITSTNPLQGHVRVG